MKLKITLFSVIFLLLFIPKPSYANDNQWTNNYDSGFIGMFDSLTPLGNKYIDMSISQPFETFYNIGQITKGTSIEADTKLYFAYSIILSSNNYPKMVSIEIPLTRAIFLNTSDFTINRIFMYYNGASYSDYAGSYDISLSNNTYYLNLYNFSNSYWQSNNNRYYVIVVELDTNILLYSDDSGVVYNTVNEKYYPSPDTVWTNSFQNISYPLYQIYNNITRISRYFASDSKLIAEEASQPVIDEALDDFTGEGSASVKVRDISSAKDVSNSLKSGLDSGGSAGEALNVLSPNNAFWGWFSQDCASYFDYTDPQTVYVDIPFTQLGKSWFYNTSGLLKYNTQYSKYSATDYIDVHNFYRIKYSRISNSSTVPRALFIYDSEYNLIASVNRVSSQFWTYTDAGYILPDNAYYIALNFFDPDTLTGAYIKGSYKYDTNLRSKPYNPDAIPDVISGYDEEYNRYIHKEDER